MGSEYLPQPRTTSRGQTAPTEQSEGDTLIERTGTAASAVGLHASPAAIFAKAAAGQPVEVTTAREGSLADGALDAASILSLQGLSAEHGDRITLRAEGDGAEEALEALVRLLKTDHDA